MLLDLCKSKIHRATVTEADLNYQGSLTIDRDLMDAARLRAHERVLVVNINTGDRFETYIIEGERGSGTICLNGAAARLGRGGDLVIIISFAMYSQDEAEGHEPFVVLVDGDNRIVRTSPS